MESNFISHFNVSPPPNSIPATSLPLTFFDIPWLFFSQTQPLFFFEYPHSLSHFLSSSLPKLKHSFSLALQHFFPFAGTLTLLPGSNKPVILYNEGNSVSFTIAMSDNDFLDISSNHPRNEERFRALVPTLQSMASKEKGIPLLAVQVTVFPNHGLCIGFAYHRVVSDGRTFNNFIKTWTSLYKNDSALPESLPFYNREVIKDVYGLESIFLNKWLEKNSSNFDFEGLVIGLQVVTPVSDDIVSEQCHTTSFQNKLPHITFAGLQAESVTTVSHEIVRATFVMRPNDMEKIKKRIIAQCKEKNKLQPPNLSPSNLTCAFIWVCLVKAQEKVVGEKSSTNVLDNPIHFGFNSGGINRLNYPSTYFGNCIGFARCTASRNHLLGEDGIVKAADVIGNKVKELNEEVLEGSESWVFEWEVFRNPGPHIVVSGSPKIDIYEIDFGWGRPRKIEEVSLGENGNVISFMESRDVKGGIEAGLVMSKDKMDAFEEAFSEGLNLGN